MAACSRHLLQASWLGLGPCCCALLLLDHHHGAAGEALHVCSRE
jgi:hypothetical protein